MDKDLKITPDAQDVLNKARYFGGAAAVDDMMHALRESQEGRIGVMIADEAKAVYIDIPRHQLGLDEPQPVAAHGAPLQTPSSCSPAKPAIKR